MAAAGTAPMASSNRQVISVLVPAPSRARAMSGPMTVGSWLSAANGDATLGVGLGRLGEQGLVGDAHDSTGDQDLTMIEVDLRPAQRALVHEFSHA